MFDRIGFSTRPDPSLSELVHLSQTAIQGALPPALAPLAEPSQSQIIGANQSHGEGLRLEIPGKVRAVYQQIQDIRSAMTRLERQTNHRFASIEQAASPILKAYHRSLTQLSQGLFSGKA
ncbi:MAG: hypothetical protein I8H75_05780 [Myxococcaceae bacterium]|nr:hypothetical protein [Myxococcaceae bacterium]MBH2006826.1 hypothetical protein [Myxococcaceae bacterium]